MLVIIPFTFIAACDGVLAYIPVFFAISLVAYFAPDRWPVLILICLPVLDFSTITGWQIVEAYDLVLLLIAGILLLKRRFASLYAPGWVAVCIGLLYLYGLINGLTYISTPSSPSLIPQLTSTNAFKLSKPVLWVVLFLPFINYQIKRRPSEFARNWIIGLMLGVIALAVLVFFEHASIAAYYDISTTFRAVGGFKTMRLGGQEIDGYLLFALPACLYALSAKANYKLRCLAICAGACGAYTVLMTNTRWTYIASILTLLVGAYFVLRLQNEAIRRKNSLIITSCGLGIVVGLFLILSNENAFITERFGQLHEDVNLRAQHWRKNLSETCTNFLQCSVGHGTGSYPTFNIAGEATHRKPATALIDISHSGSRLRFIPGNRIYASQRLLELPEATLDYRLELQVLRANVPLPIEITISICRHNMVNSYQCIKKDLFVEPGPAKLIRGNFSVEEISQIARGPRHGNELGRIIVFAIHSADAEFAVDNISIKPSMADEPRGKNLIRNGNFEQGTNYWFALSDLHLLWHAKNLFLHLLVEYGLIGVILHLVLLWVLWRPNADANAPLRVEKRVIAITLFGFVIAGFTGSLLDNAKLKFIFLLTAVILLAIKNSQPQLNANALKEQRP